MQWRKDSLFKNDGETTIHPHVEKNESRHGFNTVHKN